MSKIIEMYIIEYVCIFENIKHMAFIVFISISPYFTQTFRKLSQDIQDLFLIENKYMLGTKRLQNLE